MCTKEHLGNPSLIINLSVYAKTAESSYPVGGGAEKFFDLPNLVNQYSDIGTLKY